MSVGMRAANIARRWAALVDGGVDLRTVARMSLSRSLLHPLPEYGGVSRWLVCRIQGVGCTILPGGSGGRPLWQSGFLQPLPYLVELAASCNLAVGLSRAVRRGTLELLSMAKGL